MQKITFASAADDGTHKIDVVPGQTLHLSHSGTYSVALEVKYLTAPGVYVSYATPVSLASPGETTVINVGAHSELALVATWTSGTATVIANTAALQERGR